MSGVLNGLSCANAGDLDAYLTLVETGRRDRRARFDSHYSSVLRTRKLAVSSLTPTVEYSGKYEQIAESVRNLIKIPEFNDLLDNLLDALGKGYSVSEIMWRDPRFFMFHQDNPDAKQKESEFEAAFAEV